MGEKPVSLRERVFRDAQGWIVLAAIPAAVVLDQIFLGGVLIKGLALLFFILEFILMILEAFGNAGG